MQDGDDRLRGRLRGDPLDGQRNDLSGPFLALLPGLRLDVADQHGRVPPGVGLDDLDKFGPRLGGGEPGSLLQRPAAFLLQVDDLRAPPGEFGLPGREVVVPGLDVAGLFVHDGGTGLQPLFALGETGVPLAQLRPQRPHLLLGLRPEGLRRLPAGLARLRLDEGATQRRLRLGPFPQRSGVLLRAAEQLRGFPLRLLPQAAGLPGELGGFGGLALRHLGISAVLAPGPGLGRRQAISRAQDAKKKQRNYPQAHEHAAGKHDEENAHRSSSLGRDWPAVNGPKRRGGPRNGLFRNLRNPCCYRQTPEHKRMRRRPQTSRSGPATLV